MFGGIVVDVVAGVDEAVHRPVGDVVAGPSGQLWASPGNAAAVVAAAVPHPMSPSRNGNGAAAVAIVVAVAAAASAVVAVAAVVVVANLVVVADPSRFDQGRELERLQAFPATLAPCFEVWFAVAVVAVSAAPVAPVPCPSPLLRPSLSPVFLCPNLLHLLQVQTSPPPLTVSCPPLR